MIPWKEVTAAVSKVFTLTQEMQKNKADINQASEKLDVLSMEAKSLTRKVGDLALAIQRVGSSLFSVVTYHL